VVVKEPFK